MTSFMFIDADRYLRSDSNNIPRFADATLANYQDLQRRQNIVTATHFVRVCVLIYGCFD